MAAKKRRSVYQSGYVHGNTVRKLEPARTPDRREPKIRKKPRVSYRTIRRNQEKALHMDLPYVIVLTLAAVITLCICVSYLKLQSSVTERVDNIKALEQDVELLKSANDDLEMRIHTYVDLDHVYKVATEELGMVYANRNQVILYDKTESEYIKQNEDIPKR